MEMQGDIGDVLVQKKDALISFYTKKLKKLRNIAFGLNSEHAKCLQWTELQLRGELLQANMYQLKKGCSSISLENWHTGKSVDITLDVSKDPYENVKMLFELAKRCRSGIPKIENKLQHINAQISSLTAIIEQINAAATVVELAQFACAQPAQTATNKQTPRMPYHHYVTASGLNIWAGKKAIDNDKVTFQFASGNDFWLHASGISGSHVIIKAPKGTDLDDESLQDALQIALMHSKAAAAGAAEVILTQRKYVNKYAKSKAGTVYVSKHKTFYVRADLQRIESIKARTYAVK